MRTEASQSPVVAVYLNHRMIRTSESGQSLIELVIGITIGALFMTAAIGIIGISLRLDVQSKSAQIAAELAQQQLAQARVFGNADWHNLDTITRESSFHLATTTTFYAEQAGPATTVVDGATYSAVLTVQDVYRDSFDAVVASSTAGASADPSTLKLTTTISWTEQGQPSSLVFVEYLNRTRDRVWQQTDWSGGAQVQVPTNNPGSMFATSTNITYASSGTIIIASTSANILPSALAHDPYQTLAGLPGVAIARAETALSIDPIQRYAWNDLIGWLDFRMSGTVSVVIDPAATTTITGYARNYNAGGSSIGDVALDCATPPGGGSVCSSSNFSVQRGPNGVLTGYGWSDAIGWISFNCDNGNSCANNGGVDYSVIMDGVDTFYGWAWNDAIGWISFNCDHSGDGYGQNTCASSGGVDYSLKAGPAQVSVATLTSLAFDTERTLGAAFNSIMYRGSKPLGTNVLFQFATSNSSNGPWIYVGPDGATTSYYQPTGPDVQLRISRANHNNYRFISYKIRLESDPALVTSPSVDDSIINWSQ